MILVFYQYHVILLQACFEIEHDRTDVGYAPESDGNVQGLDLATISSFC